MIESVYIQNFKSLSAFGPFRLGKFNCLVGMNGAGKSTILQALDFVAQLMHGRVDEWLNVRGWTMQDLPSKPHRESNLEFEIHCKTNKGRLIIWRASFNRNSRSCSSEHVVSLDSPARSDSLDPDWSLEVKKGRYRSLTMEWKDIAFKYPGSILSALKDEELSEDARALREELRGLCSLELLSPHLMRQRARKAGDDIGVGGEKLSAFLHGTKGETKEGLVELLRAYYPSLDDFKVAALKGGWKSLSIFENFEGKRVESEARHMSDGVLRVLAVLAQTAANRPLILLDEIENGINPELVEQLMDHLVGARQQVIVTTHSPMILNFLEDEVARQAVQFIYKNAQGETRVRPMFEIPRMADKLRIMGPGEAYVDTDLNRLAEECLVLDEQEGPGGAMIDVPTSHLARRGRMESIVRQRHMRRDIASPEGSSR